MLRRLILGLMLVLVSVPQWSPTRAAEQRCFNVPGVHDCISGRFLEYWEENGGLPVFGYPLSPARSETTPEGTFTVQYFERQRFELHPENARPYDVLLGRLGDEIYQRRVGDWRSLPILQPKANCQYFPQTQRNLCEPFLSYWRNHGLNDPALDDHGQSLMLLGLPLTEPRLERNPDGHTVMTQWFERARMEDHGTNGVLLGRLGAELLALPSLPPQEDFQAAVLNLLNHERTSRGLQPLQLNSLLNQAAQTHSEDMARNNFFSHTGSDGSNAGDRIARTGYAAQGWAENIAAGYWSAQEVVKGWMESEGHRRNILSPDYREIGIGRAENPDSTYGVYWTTDFSRR